MALDDAFYPALRAWGEANGVEPSWLLIVIYQESFFDPSQHSPSFKYVGINQINRHYLASHYHVAHDDYLTWPASRQLIEVAGPWYSDKLKESKLGRPPRSPGVFYAYNLAPSVVSAKGDAPDVILYASPSSAYVQNSGLVDRPKDGTLRIYDLDTHLFKRSKESTFQKALAKLSGAPIPEPAAWAPNTPPRWYSPAGPRSLGQALGLGAAVVGAAGLAALIIHNHVRH